MKFCCIDTETTGLFVAYGDRICEIALINFDRRFRQTAVFSGSVDPRRKISAGAYEVNHIEEEEFQSAPKFSEVAEEVLDLVTGRILVGHNVHFDYDFLKNEMRLQNRKFELEAMIDTVEVARDLVVSNSYGLGILLRLFDIVPENRHRALGDCRATFELFKKLYLIYTDKFSDNLVEFVRRYGRHPEDAVAVLPDWLKIALAEKSEIEIVYTSRGKSSGRRKIKPISVYSAMGRTYLEAYCHLRNSRRTFLVQRIEKPR
jgi:DNA polymerase III subunit epsilon